MANIADLFGRLLLDDTGFEASVVKSAQKAGDKAGVSLGQALSKSLKVGGLAALSAAFATAGRGALELDVAVKQYAADVGASAEESDRAKDAAIDLFKVNRQGYNEILTTLAKLRTDQGLSIEQANKLADSYLKFAKVARSDAPAAVAAFDDILDAFNLEAADGTRLMDLLVASNQKFGGSLQQRLGDLKALAPQLQGLNLSVEDGIALQNLFAESGLDAARATFALNTAVRNLKPGETFDDLIARISAIEDPTKRAQAAIEVFGARGGVALAQALRPGITSLDDFAISATDAAGSVKAASDEIDSSIPAQFQLALKNIQGSLVDLVGPAGSIASVVLALTSLGVSFDILKGKAIAAWLATLGPVALAAGAGIAFIALIEHTKSVDAAQRAAAISAGDLTGAQAKLTAEAEAGTISWDDYDIKLSAVRQAQELQARLAVLAAGGTNQLADAAGKAAVANDVGATAAELAALANEKLADGTAAYGTAAGESITKVEGASDASAELARQFVLVQAGIEGFPRWFLQGGTAIDTFAGKVEDALVPARQFVRVMGEIAESIPGVGVSLGESFLSDLDQGARNAAAAAKRAADAKAEADRRALEAQRLAKAAAAEHARVVRGEVADAFRAAKSSADAFFESLHRHNLQAIEDARTAANAILEEQKRALFEPVDAAQAELDAKRKAEQRRDLQRSLAEAARGVGEARQDSDPKALASAVARLQDARNALADFDAQATIDAQRAAAQATVDQLTAQQKANDDKAALAVTAENTTAAARKKAFDDGLAKLENRLLTEKGSHAKTLAAIAKLYVDAGIDSKSSGAQIALGLAAGLLSEIAAVESAAKTLAGAVARYIRVKSPAEAGPLAEDPAIWGSRLSQVWISGVAAAIKTAQGEIGESLRAFAALFNRPLPMAEVEAPVVPTIPEPVIPPPVTLATPVVPIPQIPSPTTPPPLTLPTPIVPMPVIPTPATPPAAILATPIVPTPTVPSPVIPEPLVLAAPEVGTPVVPSPDVPPAITLPAPIIARPTIPEPLVPGPVTLPAPVMAAPVAPDSPRPGPPAPDLAALIGFDLKNEIKKLTDQLAAVMPEITAPALPAWPTLPAMTPAYASAGPIAPNAPAAAGPSLAGGPLQVEVHQVLDIGNALYGSNRFIDHVSRGLAYRRRGTGGSGG